MLLLDNRLQAADDEAQYLKENLGALNIKLSPEELLEVRRVAQAADASKLDRYPQVMMETLFVDTPELE